MTPRLALAASIALSALATAPVAGDELGPRVLHLPVLQRRAEQGILTPVPIEVGLPVELAASARRVLVHYRVWGDPDWTTLELRRRGDHWTGAIPCLEVSTITGDLRYYFRVHDAEGRVVASGGSRVKPFVVVIRHDTTLAKGGVERARCPDPSDCPRGLPGCPSEAVKIVPCKSDGDCEGDATCSWRNVCEKTDRRLNWLSVGAEQDVGLVSTTNMCSVEAQEKEGSACFRQLDGRNYTGNAVAKNGPVRAGRGPSRLVIGYERVVFYQSSLGVRAGWAFAGEGPTLRGAAPFVPWSLALRASHWFGDDPFAHSGFRPFVFMTAGYAQFDVKTRVRVREDPTKYDLQGDNDLEQTLDAYKRAGDGFAGLGAGVTFAPTSGAALGAEIAVLEAFPFGATVIAPTLSATVGF